MSSLYDVASCVGNTLSELYDVPFYLEEDLPVGQAFTDIDAYTMTADAVYVGCAPSGFSFECDACSVVVAICHEFGHIPQLLAAHDDRLRLDGLSYDVTSSVCESFVAIQPHQDYRDRHYRFLPHEIDAERRGTELGLQWLDDSFGLSFVTDGMRERLSNLPQDVYPVSLPLAKLCVGNRNAFLSLFDTSLRVQSAKFMTGHFRDLLRANVRCGDTSPVLVETLDSCRSLGVSRDVSVVGGNKVAFSDLSRFVDDDYCP